MSKSFNLTFLYNSSHVFNSIQSSESRNIIYSPVAIFIALFLATPGPLFFCVKNLNLWSLFAYFLNTSKVLSVDPSSAQIISIFFNVWFFTLFKHLFRYSSLLYAQIMMDIFGVLDFLFELLFCICSSSIFLSVMSSSILINLFSYSFWFFSKLFVILLRLSMYFTCFWSIFSSWTFNFSCSCIILVSLSSKCLIFSFRSSFSVSNSLNFVFMELSFLINSFSRLLYFSILLSSFFSLLSRFSCNCVMCVSLSFKFASFICIVISLLFWFFSFIFICFFSLSSFVFRLFILFSLLFNFSVHLLRLPFIKLSFCCFSSSFSLILVNVMFKLNWLKSCDLRQFL